MTDLFGLEQQTPRTNDRKEGAALLEVLKTLRAQLSWFGHPSLPHVRLLQTEVV
ncbi:MAG: hypothetical protein Q7T78_03385 [Rhodoferax sp.]|nr:hypothetical protein [Rhodoferax sp.]